MNMLENTDINWRTVIENVFGVISFNVRTPCKINIGYTSTFQPGGGEKKTNTVLLFW